MTTQWTSLGIKQTNISPTVYFRCHGKRFPSLCVVESDAADRRSRTAGKALVEKYQHKLQANQVE